MEAKESARQKKAKKTIEAFEAARQKWTTRLTHLKVLMFIISLGLGRSTKHVVGSQRAEERALVCKKMAVGCLMAWIYYIVVGYLTGLLAVPKEDEEKPAKKRKNIPTARFYFFTFFLFHEQSPIDFS